MSIIFAYQWRPSDFDRPTLTDYSGANLFAYERRRLQLALQVVRQFLALLGALS